MKKSTLILLLLSLLISTPALAREWQLDPVHTGFLFEIKHIYATVRGQFGDFSGTIIFDPDHPEKSKFDLVVKTESINTNNGKRDTHLRSDDFFGVRTYPVMTFKSNKVTRAADNRYRVDGTLTIKDVSVEMPLEFIYHGQRDNPLKKGEIVAGLDAGFTLDRLAFHVGDGKFYNMGAVGKDVDVLITIEMMPR